MVKVFILFFAMAEANGFQQQLSGPVIKFQQEFNNSSDCNNALEKLKQAAARSNLKVIVGDCIPAEA